MVILKEILVEQRLKQGETNSELNYYEILLTILLFGSIGAVAWAIRGTAGWGGVDGAVVPGLMWGMLWYYLSYRKGIDARGVVLWLGLGIALGGELGYGQYVSWIQGNFSTANGTIAINPSLGYFWLVLCGIGWGAPGGIVLGWAIGKRVSTQIWIVRSLILLVLLILLFISPAVDWLGELLLKTNSGILFPNAHLGLYNGVLDKHLERTVYTNTQNFAVVIWWIIALIAAAWQRDKATLITGLLIGGGFGIGFMQSALWTLGYYFAPDYIDWWKVWELNAGFDLGLIYAVVLFWSIRRNNSGRSSSESLERSKFTERRDTLFLAVAGFVLTFIVGFEYFLWTGLALSLFYFITTCFALYGNIEPIIIAEKRKRISFIYSIFFLVFIMFHGVSERLGVVCKLFSSNEVSQYSWPLNRVLLFLPMALLITTVAVYRMWKIFHFGISPNQDELRFPKQGIRIIDLMTLMGFIGAISIWPSKISVFYALFLLLAVFAFNRLEHHFNRMEMQLPSE